MRLLNTIEKENHVKHNKGKKFWYRVAVLKYDNEKLGYYTCVVDKPQHQAEIENRPNFICWGNPVEYFV